MRYIRLFACLMFLAACEERSATSSPVVLPEKTPESLPVKDIMPDGAQIRCSTDAGQCWTKTVKLGESFLCPGLVASHKCLEKQCVFECDGWILRTGSVLDHTLLPGGRRCVLTEATSDPSMAWRPRFDGMAMYQCQHGVGIHEPPKWVKVGETIECPTLTGRQNSGILTCGWLDCIIERSAPGKEKRRERIEDPYRAGYANTYISEGERITIVDIRK